MKTIHIPGKKAFPKQIYYGHECYKIRYKKRLGCFGMTDSEKKVITIKSGLSPRQLLATIVHELLHVIEFERPIKIRHKQVYKLEAAIVELLLDNFL